MDTAVKLWPKSQFHMILWCWHNLAEKHLFLPVFDHFRLKTLLRIHILSKNMIYCCMVIIFFCICYIFFFCYSFFSVVYLVSFQTLRLCLLLVKIKHWNLVVSFFCTKSSFLCKQFAHAHKTFLYYGCFQLYCLSLHYCLKMPTTPSLHYNSFIYIPNKTEMLGVWKSECPITLPQEGGPKREDIYSTTTAAQKKPHLHPKLYRGPGGNKRWMIHHSSAPGWSPWDRCVSLDPLPAASAGCPENIKTQPVILL